MTLIDTNILLDLLTDDPVWSDWSSEALHAARAAGPLMIDEIVYAELSVRFETILDLDTFLATTELDLAGTPRAALFLAGKAFRQYRAAGGARTGVLPDFFIGAHAAVLRIPLLTRDARRYRRYFPNLALIAP